MTRLLTATILGVTFVFSGCGVPDYDKVRYEKMERIIVQSTNMLAGLSLSQASKLLSLEDARWDEGYSNAPLGQKRIYHFRGFCLWLELEVRPPGITPGSTQSFSYMERDLRSNGVWWVAHFWPHLQIDRLSDSRTRMSNYWDNVNASFRVRGAEERVIEAKMRAETNK
jgi:hypothetical protein